MDSCSTEEAKIDSSMERDSATDASMDSRTDSSRLSCTDCISAITSFMSRSSRERSSSTTVSFTAEVADASLWVMPIKKTAAHISRATTRSPTVNCIICSD